MPSVEIIDTIRCAMCKHYREQLTCAAFPDDIPEDILTGIHKHETPYPGDNGIQFELRDDAENTIEVMNA